MGWAYWLSFVIGVPTVAIAFVGYLGVFIPALNGNPVAQLSAAIALIAVFTFMGVWNDFMGPLLFLSDQRLYPISLGLYALNAQEGGNTGMMMAGSLLMTLPVIALFFLAQRYFIQGVTLSGMKG